MASLSRGGTLTVACLLLTVVAKPASPNILFIVADDLGYADLGVRNGGLTLTPAIDALVDGGISLRSYYAFKICSPSRASSLTGRYPWGSGFYDMSNDLDHTTTNFTLWPELLRREGNYATHAIGKVSIMRGPRGVGASLRAAVLAQGVACLTVSLPHVPFTSQWDVGLALQSDTPTHRGFDSFFGYLSPCNGDYWTHSASGGIMCGGVYNASLQDWSNSTSAGLAPADRDAINGTYNRQLVSDRAVSIIAAHPTSQPLMAYIAFMNGHEACADGPKTGVQAPLSTVGLYNTTQLDTYKLAGAMVTELDIGVAAIVAALKARPGMWENSVLVFISDNGGE